MIKQKHDKEKRDIRIVFLIFSGISGLLAYRSYPSVLSYALIAGGILLLIFIAFSPMTLRPAFRLWLKFAHIIEKVNTKILLFVIFSIIFVPVGLMMRFFGKDPMQRKKKEGTCWEPYEISGIKDKSRYERQF